MPSAIATIVVKEDKIDEARKLFSELAAEVASNEPGTQAYIVHQKAGDPKTFIFYEKYSDEAAIAAHRKNLAAVGKRFAAVMDGPPEILAMEEI
jgi:quinol monooxygenase YgiN